MYSHQPLVAVIKYFSQLIGVLTAGADGMDQCEFVHCGPNSECKMMKTAVPSSAESDTMDARCVCLPGFSQSWEQPDTCVKGELGRPKLISIPRARGQLAACGMLAMVNPDVRVSSR